MPAGGLSASSYVVLGLLEVYGPGTPYDLKRWVDGSIGYFWTFPRAQLYVEPPRLATMGLLQETREAEGRRRRVYEVTEAGRVVLRAWLAEPGTGITEIRDPGLLKLFFAGTGSREEVVALAREQEALHARRLAEYERIQPGVASHERGAFALVTLRLGLRHERLAVDFWREIAESPPG